MQLDAYIRVSEVRGRSGESFISPSDQKDRIVAWAKSQGHEIAEVHEELDVSGGTTDRPLLNEVMRRIEAGETGGVVVAKLDRFGRALVGSLELIKRIQDAGGLFASVADNFDITTPTGRLVLNMMLSIAQWELERIGASWAEARSRAIARGVHIGGNVPFGYSKREDGRLEVDLVAGRLVTEVFERRASGQGWATIRNWLRSAGGMTATGQVWSDARIRSMVNNRVYLGELIDKASGTKHEGAHPPLIDPATFQAANNRRGVRAGAASPRAETLLRGLVRCAGCRYTMGPLMQDHTPGGFTYKCSRAYGAGDCEEPAYIKATDLTRNQHVDEVFERVGDDVLELILAGSSAKAAAEQHDVHEWRIERWLNRGRSQPDSVYVPFATAVDEHWAKTKRNGPRPSHEPWKTTQRLNSTGLHAYVVDRLFNEKLRKKEIEAEAFGIDTEIGDLDAATKVAKAELVAYAGDREIEHAAGREAFLAGLDGRRKAADAAQAELDEALRRSGGQQSQLRHLRDDWDAMSLDDQREALATFIQAVFVRRTDPKSKRGQKGKRQKTYGASDARVHIVWTDDPPVDLPRQGRRDYVLHPFVFPDAD